MVLSLWEKGIVIDGERYEARSEHFLQMIESHVRAHGGWPAVERLTVNTHSGSFTASRGLAVLVNTLARAHGVPVSVYEGEDATRAVAAQIPIAPDYDGEPHRG